MSVTPTVVHVITGLVAGGAEQQLLRLVSSRGQHRHVVVALRSGGALAPDVRAVGVPLVELDWPRLTRLAAAPWTLRRVVREHHPTVVQGWMYHGNLAASWGAPADVPVAWNVRATTLPSGRDKTHTRVIAALGARMAARAAQVVVTNSDSAASLLASQGVPSERLTIIPNGFDLDRFHPDKADGLAMRAALGVPADAEVLGLFAHYRPMKDHATAFAAAAQLLAERPKVHLVCAGDDITWERTGARAVIPATLASRVHLLGPRRDVPRLLRACDGVVLSSVSGESFPNVLAEAMATGVPCATTPIGDAARIVGTLGVVVPAGDPAAMARGWAALLDRRSPDLSAQCRAHVAASYALPAVVAAYDALWARLAAR